MEIPKKYEDYYIECPHCEFLNVFEVDFINKRRFRCVHCLYTVHLDIKRDDDHLPLPRRNVAHATPPRCIYCGKEVSNIAHGPMHWPCSLPYYRKKDIEDADRRRWADGTALTEGRAMVSLRSFVDELAEARGAFFATPNPRKAEPVRDSAELRYRIGMSNPDTEIEECCLEREEAAYFLEVKLKVGDERLLRELIRDSYAALTAGRHGTRLKLSFTASELATIAPPFRFAEEVILEVEETGGARLTDDLDSRFGFFGYSNPALDAKGELGLSFAHQHPYTRGLIVKELLLEQCDLFLKTNDMEAFSGIPLERVHDGICHRTHTRHLPELEAILGPLNSREYFGVSKEDGERGRSCVARHLRMLDRDDDRLIRDLLIRGYHIIEDQIGVGEAAEDGSSDGYGMDMAGDESMPKTAAERMLVFGFTALDLPLEYLPEARNTRLLKVSGFGKGRGRRNELILDAELSDEDLDPAARVAIRVNLDKPDLVDIQEKILETFGVTFTAPADPDTAGNRRKPIEHEY